MVKLSRPRRLAAALLLTAWMLAGSGCAFFLPRAKPDQLGALPADKREPLAEFDEALSRARTALALAARDREIAELALRASRLKPRMADQELSWLLAHRDWATRRDLQDELLRVDICAERSAGLSDVLRAEIDASRAHLAVARAREHEAQRRFDLAEAELERARLAAVLGAPGIAVEERDEKVGKWDVEFAKRRAAADIALVERRSAEVRAHDADKVWLGLVFAWRQRHADPCRLDWRLPEPDRNPFPAIRSGSEGSARTAPGRGRAESSADAPAPELPPPPFEDALPVSPLDAEEPVEVFRLPPAE